MNPVDPFGQEQSFPAVSWRDLPVGTTITLTVAGEPSIVQQRHFETNEPLTWPDGKPRECVVLPVVDSAGDQRGLWVRKPSALFTALVEAQAAAKSGPMASGGLLHITYTGEEANKNPRLNGRKLFTAKYAPPKPVSAFDIGAGAQPPEDDIPF